MKTTVFKLENPSFGQEEPIFGPQETIYKIPTLPAYSVIDHSLDSGDYSPYETGNQQATYSLEDDCIRIQGVKNELFRSGKDRFVIHFAGVRDFSLLFPHIDEHSYRERLGQYAEEAETSFESGAWLSFMMMAGAVIEGLLDDCTPSTFGQFNTIIDKANEQGIISDADAALCHQVREARNLIHSSKHRKEYVTRTLAMDTYVFYDELIKRHWYALEII